MWDRSGEAQSQLYLLRIWTRPGADGMLTCRGKLQPVLGNRSYCFTDTRELCALLHKLLMVAAVPPAAGPASDEEPPEEMGAR